MASAEAHELLATQKLKDEALRKSFRIIDGGKTKEKLNTTQNVTKKSKNDYIDEKVTPKNKKVISTDFEDFSEFKNYGEFF